MKIFITGIAGMIGFHLAERLLAEGHEVMGVDNYNNFYYSFVLKMDRAKMLKKQGIEIFNSDFGRFALDYKPDLVIHLAAHAAVRHSMNHKNEYFENNIIKTQTLINQLEKLGVEKVIYASTSCVKHGQPLPWKESDRPLHQNNPYGMSKRTNECQFIASKIPYAIGLRFFTAYGPWGRPDMALHQFAHAMMADEPLTVYNNGNMKRDFTYVGDVVDAIMKVIEYLEEPGMYVDMSKDIFNVGYGKQVDLMQFIRLIAQELGKDPRLHFVPPHPADVPETWCDNTKMKGMGWLPTTPIEVGVSRFVDWYREYYAC